MPELSIKGIRLQPFGRRPLELLTVTEADACSWELREVALLPAAVRSLAFGEGGFCIWGWPEFDDELQVALWEALEPLEQSLRLGNVMLMGSILTADTAVAMGRVLSKACHTLKWVPGFSYASGTYAPNVQYGCGVLS